MKLNIVRADPAGNITIFVLDPVDPGRRAAVSARLMSMQELGAEQVGFVCAPRLGGDGRMEMMGGEFCGNATRAFGMLLARGAVGRNRIKVEVSGCSSPVEVNTDLPAGEAQAEMPLPLWVKDLTGTGREGVLVHLGGIAHLVVEGVNPGQDFFAAAEPLLQAIPNLDAYGVIFLNGRGDRLTPLVKVPATNTLVWEGSCGSGSLAAAVAQSTGLSDGVFCRDYIQPSGVIRATVVRTKGQIHAAYIGGSVTLSDPIQVEI